MLPSVLPALPLSFSVKLLGVASVVQLGVVEPEAGLGIVDVKLKSWFCPRGSVCLMIVTVPQLLMFTGTGAMKSFTSAPNDAEARLFTNALPKALQVPAGKTFAAVRS